MAVDDYDLVGAGGGVRSEGEGGGEGGVRGQIARCEGEVEGKRDAAKVGGQKVVVVQQPLLEVL